MRIPSSLASLADQGIIEEVVRALMSGKEAEVFLVVSDGQLRVAKVYKEAQNRTFKNRAEYTEGRKVRNSRDQRAINKRSRHGRAQDEAAWRSTEVDMIYRLRDAGVRVPTPYHFIDGVLIMELVTDAEGNPAPRLGEIRLDRDEAAKVFDQLLVEVVRMLCAGVVHGDLSDFNVLMGAEGPVIIDFPQSVDAASNQNARKLLLRDVDNLQRFVSKFTPTRPPRPYAQEMWDLYTRSLLTPETRLGGRYSAPERRVDTAALLELIGDADHDERRRREGLGLSMRGVSAVQPRRVEVVVVPGDRQNRPRPGGAAVNPPGDRQNRPRPGSAAVNPPGDRQNRPRPGGAAVNPPGDRQNRPRPGSAAVNPPGDRQNRPRPGGAAVNPPGDRQNPLTRRGFSPKR